MERIRAEKEIALKEKIIKEQAEKDAREQEYKLWQLERDLEKEKIRL